MKALKFALTTAIVFALFAGQAYSQKVTKDTLQTKGQSETLDEIWIYFADEPSGEFLEAFEKFLRDNNHEAVRHIRKGAAFVEFERRRAVDSSKKELAVMSQELRILARNVSTGKTKSVQALQDVFAQAEHALAAHHYRKALEFEKNNRLIALGHSISAARGHLRQAWAWSQASIPLEDATALKQAVEISQQLIEGKKNVQPQKIQKALEAIDKALVKFANKILGR